MSPEIRDISERMKASLGEIVFSLPNTLTNGASKGAEVHDLGDGDEDLLAFKVELVLAIAAVKAEQERSHRLSDDLGRLRARCGAFGTRLDAFPVIERHLATNQRRIDGLRDERDRWVARAEGLLNSQAPQRRSFFGWIGKSLDPAPA